MEFKVNITQIIVAIIQFLGYVITALCVAYAVGRKISKIDSTIEFITLRLNEHITKVEKTFDRIWDDRLDRLKDRREK